MFDYQDYRDFLNDELLRRTKVNPLYSMRAFAMSLGLSSGELSEVLRGKRKLSLKSALKISKSLGLTSRETKHLVDLLEKDLSNSPSPSKREVQKEPNLANEQFAIISDWHHFAILNLAECKDFEWSYTWIAKKLKIKPYEVKLAIEKMIKVGLIKKTIHKNGEVSFKVSENVVLTDSEIPSTAIKEYHRQILTKALDSIQSHAVSERDITGIGFAINKKDLTAIKKEISEFQDMLIEKYAKGKKERVYQLEVALFPLSFED